MLFVLGAEGGLPMVSKQDTRLLSPRARYQGNSREHNLDPTLWDLQPPGQTLSNKNQGQWLQQSPEERGRRIRGQSSGVSQVRFPRSPSSCAAWSSGDNNKLLPSGPSPMPSSAASVSMLSSFAPPDNPVRK